MTAHDWFIEHRAGYLWRALEPDEARLFDEHVTRCEECRRELEAMEQDLGWLAMGQRPTAPPPGFTRRVTEAVLARPVRAWKRWAWPAAAAAAVLAGAVGTWQANARADATATELAVATARAAALEDSLSVMRGAARVLQASMQVDGREAGLVIFADEKSHRWKVVVHGLPKAPPGERYTFWFICPDGMVRGADVAPTGDAPVILTLGMPEGAGPPQGAALTREPMHGDGAPQGPELAHVML